MMAGMAFLLGITLGVLGTILVLLNTSGWGTKIFQSERERALDNKEIESI